MTTNVQGSGSPAPPPASPYSSSALAVSALSGAAIAGMAIHFASRGRVSSVQAINAAFKASLESSLRQGLESSLKAQETVIQKSLHPVFAVQQQLNTLHGDVHGIKSMFNSPKTRGNYGEFQLETLIKNGKVKKMKQEYGYSVSVTRSLSSPPF